MLGRSAVGVADVHTSSVVHLPSLSQLPPKATTPTIVECTIPNGDAVSVRVSSATPTKGSCVAVYGNAYSAAAAAADGRERKEGRKW